MKKLITKNKQFEGSFGSVEIATDFLPPPESLIYKPKSVRVTILLEPETVIFFKNQAKKHNASYQRMIRNVLDMYASRFQSMEQMS